MSYIGNEPIVSATRTVTEVTATAGQTSFTPNGGYTVGFLDVFINGSKLTNTDFTATNGTTVTLTEAAQAGDIVRLEALGTFLTSSAVALNGNSNITGNLNVSGNLGVGTTSPSGKVHTSVSDGTTNAVYAERTGGAPVQFAVRFANQYSNLISSGVLSLHSANTESGRFDGSGNFLFNSGYGSVATAYGCRAWVNFNGSGTVAIRASGNVSSITDNGTGQYTVNLSTAMPDGNYAIGLAQSSGGGGGSSSMYAYVDDNTSPRTTTNFRIVSLISNGSAFFDTTYMSAAIFR